MDRQQLAKNKTLLKSLSVGKCFINVKTGKRIRIERVEPLPEDSATQWTAHLVAFENKRQLPFTFSMEKLADMIQLNPDGSYIQLKPIN